MEITIAYRSAYTQHFFFQSPNLDHCQTELQPHLILLKSTFEIVALSCVLIYPEILKPQFLSLKRLGLATLNLGAKHLTQASQLVARHQLFWLSVAASQGLIGKEMELELDWSSNPVTTTQSVGMLTPTAGPVSWPQTPSTSSNMNTHAMVYMWFVQIFTYSWTPDWVMLEVAAGGTSLSDMQTGNLGKASAMLSAFSLSCEVHHPLSFSNYLTSSVLWHPPKKS